MEREREVKKRTRQLWLNLCISSPTPSLPVSHSLSLVSILLRATWRMSNGYKKPPLNVANLWALFVASL